MISINQFDPLEAQSDLFESIDKNEKTDEFSMLLMSISAALPEMKAPDKTGSECSKIVRSIESITEFSSDNRISQTSEFQADSLPREETGISKIFEDRKIFTANHEQWKSANAVAQNNFPKTENSAAELSREKNIYEKNGESLAAENHFSNGDIEIVTDKTASKVETMRFLTEKGFVNINRSDKSNENDFLPKIFRSVTDRTSENNALTPQPDTASDASGASLQSTKTIVDNFSKPKASDVASRNFPLFKTETKESNFGAEKAESASANDFIQPTETFTKFADAVKNAAQNSADGETVFKQITANLHEEIFIFAAKPEKTNVLKLRLRPAELGAVEIKLEKSDSGKLKAHFHTENETTRQILVERSEQLRIALENSGYQVERLDVSCDSSASAGSESRENQSRNFENIENRSSKAETAKDVSEDDSDSNRLVSLRA